jgi:hypothetical protein
MEVAIPVSGATKYEDLFRRVSGLDVDKSDLKRLEEFLIGTLGDLLLMGKAAAGANNRTIIRPYDLPVTKGIQENIHEFRRLDSKLELKPILQGLAVFPQFNGGYDAETEEFLPELLGGLTVALSRIFRTLEPGLRNPQTEHWEKALEIFSILS